MSAPWRVMIWKMVRSPEVPRNMGFSSALIFLRSGIVQSQQWTRQPQRAYKRRTKGTGCLLGGAGEGPPEERFILRVGIRRRADQVLLHAAVEHARLAGAQRAVAFEQQPGVREEPLLEGGAIACAELGVELLVQRRLAREEVDRTGAVGGETGAGGDGLLGLLGLEELLHRPDLAGDVKRKSWQQQTGR